jgi:dTDP-4-dehydrorhamnose reductase
VKVLVLGAGQVASATVATTPAAYRTLQYGRTRLDIEDHDAVERTIDAEKPDWIVNAAAYTAVDRAEDEPQRAAAVNDVAVAGLVRSAQRHGSRLLHISTDFVFDGRMNRAYRCEDATGPLNVYGATKLAGERHVLEAGAGPVLRTSWVYAASGQNFVLTMLRLMRERPKLAVVCDQIGAPTWARSLAEAIWGLIQQPVASGLFHWCDLGVASWFDFAVAIQDEALVLGLLPGRIPILPIQSNEYPVRARRPAFSVLDTRATRALLPVAASHWRHNLKSMLNELHTA